MGAPDFEKRGTRRFQIVRRLGSGGMGMVYEVVDREQHTRLALKTLRTLSADALVRFKREFRVLQGLQHPNLVTLGELFEEGGQWFYTMELVHGAHLLEWVRPSAPVDALLASPAVPRVPDGAEQVGGARLDEQRLRESLAQLGRALEALHRMNKVHRDIKPSNILVTPEGRVVLVDYGLVTDVAPPPDAERSEGDVVGTTAYMAPEQAASRKVGPYSDWYAVGVLLYEALTGRQPFAGAPLEVLMNKQRFEPPAPHTLAPAVPADLDALCVELLRIEPAARPVASEIMRRLGAAPPPDEPHAQSPAPPAPPFVGRSIELQSLEDAFAAVQAGEAVTVCVHGESGVGKSALVRRFVDALKSPPRALVLFGRCYERESVPYKALDGVIATCACCRPPTRRRSCPAARGC